VETITVGPGGMVVGQEGQVLQVLSLKDAQALTKGVSPLQIKEEADVAVVVSTEN
jgi:ribosomal protein L24E